jgi:hypothetical protein
MSFRLFFIKVIFYSPFAPQISVHLSGWWVGFGCGWVKLNVLQKRWLVCRLAALLILRSVGILSTVFLSVYVRSVGRPKLAGNGFGLCVRAGYGAQSFNLLLKFIRSTKLQICTSARLTQSPCACCTTKDNMFINPPA